MVSITSFYWTIWNGVLLEKVHLVSFACFHLKKFYVDGPNLMAIGLFGFYISVFLEFVTQRDNSVIASNNSHSACNNDYSTGFNHGLFISPLP